MFLELGASLWDLAGRIFGDVLPVVGKTLVWKTASLVFSLMLFALFFGGIFKSVPNIPIARRDIWPGAILTSTLFTIGKAILALYFSWRSFDSVYGAAGSLIVIMVWVYFSAQIFFFGAAFTHVYADVRQGHGAHPNA